MHSETKRLKDTVAIHKFSFFTLLLDINHLSIILFFFQSLLQSNTSAAFLDAQLSETEWSVSDVADFLTKASEDRRPSGSAYTWRDAFNETDRAIKTISQFMEVSELQMLWLF